MGGRGGIVLTGTHMYSDEKVRFFSFGIEFHLCGMEEWNFWFSRLGKGFLVAILAKGSTTDWTTYQRSVLEIFKV